MQDEKTFDVVLLYSTQDHPDLVVPLMNDLWQLGAFNVDAREIPVEGSGSPPELLTSCISETYFVALIISKWTPIYPWPKLEPAEVELLHEHAIIIYYDLPMTIMRRLSPQLADLEYIEASGGSAAVARYLVSILKANPQTFFKRQAANVRNSIIRNFSLGTSRSALGSGTDANVRYDYSDYDAIHQSDSNSSGLRMIYPQIWPEHWVLIVSGFGSAVRRSPF